MRNGGIVLKKRFKKKLAVFVVTALIVLSVQLPVFAADTVIDLGTFRNTAVGTLASKDLSGAWVNYTYEKRYRGSPVMLTIHCIHESGTGKHIPEDCYSVTYQDNNRPGTAKAIIEGKNGYTGSQTISYEITGVYVAQAPSYNDIISEKRTVVANGTTWRIIPSFNVSRVRTTDSRYVGVSRKKDKDRSTKQSPWYYAQISARKAGIERIILDGTNGERASYIIYVETPKFIKNSLKFNDITTVSMADYITGVTYLRPHEVTSSKIAVATVSGDFSINVLSNGSSKITLRYGKKKISNTLTAKLPTFSNAKITLKNKPVKLKMKNLPKGASISYSSSDPLTVKVNPEGYAAPVRNGSATISAKVGKVTANCTVTVKGL